MSWNDDKRSDHIELRPRSKYFVVFSCPDKSLSEPLFILEHMTSHWLSENCPEDFVIGCHWLSLVVIGCQRVTQETCDL